MSLSYQCIPIITPIDQSAVVRAVTLDSKLSKPLYTSLGIDINKLKKVVTAEISRGIATSLPYSDISRNLKAQSGIPKFNADRIVRTEGHRIQQQSANDARRSAISKGARLVKVWKAVHDNRTRTSHQYLDGEIREDDEAFSNGLLFPGDPQGAAGEVINCRCRARSRAKGVLDNAELDRMKERASYFGVDKARDYEEYKKKYTQAGLMVNTPGGIGEKAVPYSKRGIELDKKLKSYMKVLKSNGDYIADKAGAFNLYDLAIMSTETGVEYTTITVADKSYLIRGNDRGTKIPDELYKILISEKGTLDAHSHPYIGDLVPSESDLGIFDLLTWQENSVIIEPTQNAVKYNADGVLFGFSASKKLDDDYFDGVWDAGD